MNFCAPLLIILLIKASRGFWEMRLCSCSCTGQDSRQASLTSLSDGAHFRSLCITVKQRHAELQKAIRAPRRGRSYGVVVPSSQSVTYRQRLCLCRSGGCMNMWPITPNVYKGSSPDGLPIGHITVTFDLLFAEDVACSLRWKKYSCS